MEAYHRTFRLGVDDHCAPSGYGTKAKGSAELLTVPFPFIEIIFTIGPTVFESTGYHRVFSTAVGGIQTQPIRTQLQTDYRAFGVFLHPVEFFEATGLGAADLHDPVQMGRILNPLISVLESGGAEDPESFTHRIQDAWKRYQKKRSCYRVITQFLDQAHALPRYRLREAAGAISFTGKHLRTTFRAVLGITPKQYLQLLQLQGVLSDMVNSGGYSLTDIALRNGFYDQSHFNRIFKRYAGIPPRRFRGQYSRYAEKYKNTIVL
ncbi:MAG: helix-turn-helix domain-containing protein [Phaeodactylibacter sp.]|uniref:helix-turn-helix domain-containing protein n=1 Tax=Phaeodactylibacter sp. TaxID=1940289 RepID=UPI0032F09BF3